jgi:transcriptional regulator with PAS, ATPase and Fis domain
VPDESSNASFPAVLVLDHSGAPRYSAGLAAEPAVASALRAQWSTASRDSRRVFAMQVGPLHAVVVAVASDDATVLVAMPRVGADALFELAASVEFAGDILVHLLTNPFEALTVVDRAGVVRYISPVHEHFFGIEPGAGVGRHVTQVIENTRLHEVAQSGRAEIGQLQEMKGTTRVVSRMPVHDVEGKVVGAIGQVMFKGPEQLHHLSRELTRLRSEVAYYRRELSSLRNRSYGIDQIVGESAAIRRLKAQITKVAPLDVPVLLVGESGTGKELVAHAIHLLSPRREGPLMMVNAAALPATLVESELFGYEPGAFTGAERKGRRGKIEQADRGTLFFDEVGDMPKEMQVKLLRVLQDGSFERVGGAGIKESNFRLVCASNRNFQRMIDEGEFRLDLFYRISGVTIELPPLRDRLDDIPMLVQLALRQFASRHGMQARKVSPAAIALLQQQTWPGNVRQLMHVVERAAIFSETPIIDDVDFDFGSGMAIGAGEAHGVEAADAATRETRPMVKDAFDKVETDLIRAAMERCAGNKKKAAAELGISRSYLYKRLADMGIA